MLFIRCINVIRKKKLDNKVLSLVPQTNIPYNPNVVSIDYTDGSSEIIEADAFALTEELPNCIALWKEQPYEVLGFININSIKKLRVIPKEEAYAENVG
jgi:hypothetical protein